MGVYEKSGEASEHFSERKLQTQKRRNAEALEEWGVSSRLHNYIERGPDSSTTAEVHAEYSSSNLHEERHTTECNIVAK